MTRAKTMLNCVNVSGLTFVFDNARDIDLARIRFAATQETNSTETASQQDTSGVYFISGTLDPKDSDGAYKLLQQALDDRPFAVYGRFKNTESGGEAEWQLTNVRFDHVAPGRLSGWTFHAQASKR